MNVLYISYDGALDPLGSSQVVPYLIGLSKKSIKFTLLTYEKKERLNDVNSVFKLKEILKEKNIRWEILRYHKSPTVPATAFDIIMGLLKTLVIVRRDKIKIIHARSFVGAIPALLIAKLLKLKFIFDMRGFWADERVDGGLWKTDGCLYKISKFFERKFILNSDQIVILTRKAKEIIERQFPKGIKRPIEVIPTCVDLKLFFLKDINKDKFAKVGKNIGLTFSYLGSIGTWYCLKEMVDFFKIVRQKINNAHFMFLTPNGEKAIEDIMSSNGFFEDDFIIKKLYHHEVPEWLSIADVSVFFIKPLFSKISSCPTKFAESLACGIPVITNSGIGDCDEIINKAGVGVVIEKFSEECYLKAVDKIAGLLKNREYIRTICRNTAENQFSLEKATDLYLKIYQMLK